MVALGAILFLLAVRGHSEDGVAIYDPAPEYVWNRLYLALFVRTDAKGKQYGVDSLDPLYWSSTRHLLTGESETGGIRAMDQFLTGHGEKLVRDPLRRAVLQRDLWALFDWAATRNRWERMPVGETAATALSQRLADIIRRLALTKEQIGALPDNYAAAIASKAYPDAFDPNHPDRGFLPADLFLEDGPWVCVQMQRFPSLPAPVHTEQFGGRSTFLIFVNLPGGRADTLAYLDKLNHFSEPWIFDRTRAEQLYKKSGLTLPAFPSQDGPWENPQIPQLPVGTQFALVRQALLVDDNGELVPTPLTESVQIRVYRAIEPGIADNHPQSVFEFELSRQNLFAGKAGGLREIGNEEKGFTTFLTVGIDPFEIKDTGPQTERMLNCIGLLPEEHVSATFQRSQIG
jgi:hypothetical protein